MASVSIFVSGPVVVPVPAAVAETDTVFNRCAVSISTGPPGMIIGKPSMYSYSCARNSHICLVLVVSCGQSLLHSTRNMINLVWGLGCGYPRCYLALFFLRKALIEKSWKEWEGYDWGKEWWAMIDEKKADTVGNLFCFFYCLFMKWFMISFLATLSRTHVGQDCGMQSDIVGSLFNNRFVSKRITGTC